MKKILISCEGYNFAGAESYTLNLISGLKNFTDIKLYCALFHSGLLKRKLCGESITHIELYGSSNLKSIRRLISMVRENHIELIHLVDWKSTIVGGGAAIFLKNVKMVATVHGLPELSGPLPRKIKNGFSLLIYYFLLRFFVDGIICVSLDLKRQLQKVIGSRKVRVILNGLDLRAIEAYSRSALNKEKHFNIGTLGRLEKVKGHAFFIQSAQEILRLRNDVVFHIVGSGPLEEDLKEQARLLNIADRVHFWGFREDSLAVIARMDIFVLPSLHEGIPYVLLEAMSLCKPVVCTEVGGIKEVIHDRIDGLLVPPKDPQALSEAILSLLENPDLAENLGRIAKKTVEDRFSSDLMARETYDLYHRVIKI